jgi:hypothetical protein
MKQNPLLAWLSSPALSVNLLCLIEEGMTRLCCLHTTGLHLLGARNLTQVHVFLTSCVTLDKLLDLNEFKFSFLKMGSKK